MALDYIITYPCKVQEDLGPAETMQASKMRDIIDYLSANAEDIREQQGLANIDDIRIGLKWARTPAEEMTLGVLRREWEAEYPIC